MVKVFELIVPFVLMIGLLAPAVHASSDPFSSIVDAIYGSSSNTTNSINQTTNAVMGLPVDIVGMFTGSIKNSVKGFNEILLGLTGALLTSNPDPMLMESTWQAIVYVLSSLYLIVFLVVGFGFFFAGANIQKREKAKERLKKSVMMIIGVSASFVIYQLILELSTAITQFMWQNGFEQFFSNSLLTGAGFMMLFAFMGSVGLAVVTLFLRYLILLMGVVLFPIAIFLYFAPKLRSWGKFIFEFLGMMLAMQLIDVIILVAVGQVMLALNGQAGGVLVPALGFMMVAAVNGFMIFHVVMKSASSVNDAVPFIGMAIGALTGEVGALATVLRPTSKPSGEKVVL